jgi:glycerophosphoryl diester phosphodiesterase
MKSDPGQSNDLVAAVVDLIRICFTHGDRESFDLAALSTLKGLDPDIRLAPLFERTLKRPFPVLNGLRMLDLARQLGADEIALSRYLIRPAVVARANSYDLPIVAWTIDDPGWLRRARSLGLKGLITNDPQRMLLARARLPIQ